jgi:hypothetical protein
MYSTSHSHGSSTTDGKIGNSQENCSPGGYATVAVVKCEPPLAPPFAELHPATINPSAPTTANSARPLDLILNPTFLTISKTLSRLMLTAVFTQIKSLR